MTAAVAWLRAHLFDSVWNGLLTIATLVVLVLLLRPLAEWVLTGARWSVIPDTARLLAVGPFPTGEVWRIWTLLLAVVAVTALSIGMAMGRVPRALTGGALVAMVLAFASRAVLHHESWLFLLAVTAAVPAGLWAGAALRRFRRLLTLTWLLVPLLAASLLMGVPPNLWGGLFLTVVMTVGALAIAFPLGIALALARVSSLPIVRMLSTGFVELMRGVPLVSVLFLAWLMVPLFVPENWRTPQVTRAIIGFALFNAAYISEYVRGGLQGIPKGQYEGARALGLNGFDTMYRIVLPQAIRSVVPGLVGQAITAFKNTSLVVIIGLLDLLGIAQSILGNPRFLGLEREVYLFLMVLFFTLASLMSYVGRRIEERMGLGSR
jgi:general L-amino acid transport system permease protein